MDEFSYLSVLFSIIVGLTVAEILQGFRHLLLLRERVRVYWPVLVWGFLLWRSRRKRGGLHLAYAIDMIAGTYVIKD